MDKYILDEHGNPKLEPDLITWATWYENGDNRRVAVTEVGEAKVSTVFLGLDHNWSGGPPVLWETMIFGGRLSGECCAIHRGRRSLGTRRWWPGAWTRSDQMESKSTGRALARKTQPNGDESH
jgi:hypothetical protein